MKLRTLLLGFAVVAFEAGATESVDPECREKLTRQTASLEAAFTANRSQFDSQVDELLTKYASSHPAASKEDYKAAFDLTFEQRFRKLFIHWNALSGYKDVLDSSADPRDVCKMSERKMRRESEQFAARDKALYDQIVGEMSRTFR